MLQDSTTIVSEATNGVDLLTTILAIWGAVLSTIALIWNILRDRKDRQNVEIRVAPVILSDDPTEEEFLGTTITNTGRRPVTIIGVGARRRGKKGLILLGDVNQGFPKRLDEHERYVVLTRNFELLQELLLEEEITEFWAEDSTGKHWKLSRKGLKELNSLQSQNAA